MAQVPYSYGVPEVHPETRTPEDYLHLNVNPDQFGAKIGAGLERAGQGAVTAGKYFGQVVTDDQTNSLIERWNKRLYGDPNAQVPGPDGAMMQDTGYMGLKGRAALDARPKLVADMDADLKEVNKNLVTQDQQHQFETVTRRYRQNVDQRVGQHADSQANIWGAQVNHASGNLALTHIATHADNPQEVAAGTADLIAARVKDAQLKGGGDELLKDAADSARRDALKAQTEAIAVNDPARALRMVEKNKQIAGTQYDELATKFRTRAEQQTGIGAGQKALLGTYQGGAPQNLVPVMDGIGSKYGVSGGYLARTWQIESDSGRNLSTSSAGAQGHFQFVPSTARQYGLKDPNNFEQSADAAARLAADNQAALTKRLFRPPTDAELYLAHQQGAEGAAKLLNNPNVRAGSLVGDAAIRQNGGNPDAPAAQFTGMWAAKFGGSAMATANAATLAARKAKAYDDIAADPTLNENERQHALRYVSQVITSQQIAMDATVRAQKEASDQAANGYVTRMLKNDYKGITEQIANDPALTWEAKRALGSAAERVADEGVDAAAKHYGSGFWQAYKSINAPDTDASRITDPMQLYKRAGPGGDLTLAGAEKLHKIMNDTRKSVDNQSVHTTKLGLMNYAKSKLSFEQDTGPIKIRDPKGEALFSAQFIPKFESAYDAWMKAGKNPWEFLTQENVDKLITGMRSQREMQLERLRATGDAIPEDKNAPLPPAPAGVDAKVWNTVMSAPPPTADGKPFPKAKWAEAVNLLLANPTPEFIKKFNESKFGAAGFDGAKLIEQIRGKKAESAKEAPKPVAAEPARPSILAETESTRDTPEFLAARQRTQADIQRRGEERQNLVQ